MVAVAARVAAVAVAGVGVVGLAAKVVAVG